MRDTKQKLPIAIRPITEIVEMLSVEELQKDVWGSDDREVFPALAMIPMIKVGAILLGAFDGDELVGFVFGFPGIEHGHLSLHSDLLAVKTSYRGQQLGKRLKLAQREAALKCGLGQISWTFDPLQAVNAHLNFAKLGVTSNRYLVDFYGRTTSFLHNTGSDRLWVTWDLESERVRKRLHVEPAEPPQNAKSLLGITPTTEPLIFDFATDAPALTISVPPSIDSLAAKDFPLASRWREATRNALMSSLGAGFIVEEFYRSPGGAHGGGFYVLRRDPFALDEPQA